MEIRIRRARPQDADALTAVAQAAKRFWGYPEEWLSLWQSGLTFTPGYVRSCPVYCAEAGHELVGVYGLGNADSVWTMEHLWVRPDVIRQGIGGQLLNHAIKLIRAAGGATLRIESDPNAEGFYLKMGARRIGELPSRPEGRKIPLLEMVIERDNP